MWDEEQGLIKGQIAKGETTFNYDYDSRSPKN